MRKSIKYLPISAILGYIAIILILATTTPISVGEANLFYSQSSNLTTKLMKISQTLFDYEFGFRGLFVLTSFLNGWLFYAIARHFFKTRNDKLMALFIYLMLPGTIAASVLVSDAVLISVLLSTFILGYIKKNDIIIVISMWAMGFVHWSSLEFYVIIAIYTMFVKNYRVMAYACLSVLAYLYFGGDMPDITHHSSTSRLLTIYATVFSPLFFIYFFFAGYRVLLTGNRDIVWAVSFMMFILSFIMSLYTKIRVDDFSSYLMIGVIVALRGYYSSSRVRLKRFRRSYEIFFGTVIAMLVLSSMVIILHQPIYRLFGEDVVTAVSPMYIPYDKANTLKKLNKQCVLEPTRRSMNQFKYYGITKCD